VERPRTPAGPLEGARRPEPGRCTCIRHRDDTAGAGLYRGSAARVGATKSSAVGQSRVECRAGARPGVRALAFLILVNLDRSAGPTIL
jgi:hypothetical protein